MNQDLISNQDTVTSGGNGGFAPDPASAIQGPLFRPNRFPVFRAEPGGAP